MKPHVLIRLAPDATTRALPHWTDLLDRKPERDPGLTPLIDALVRKYGLPVWTTQEHPPRKNDFDGDERAAGLDRVYRLILRSQGRVPARFLDEVRLLPEVEYARLGQTVAAPLPQVRQTSLSRVPGQWSRQAIKLEEAHAIEEGLPDVVVAVLDTGLASDHPELRGAIVPGRDFVDIIDGASSFIGDFLGVDEDTDDERGHGTHVAGIIAGAGRAMPRGVAPGCRIMPVRVLGSYVDADGVAVGAGLRDNIDQGLKWAIDQGARVINMSLGLLVEREELARSEAVRYGLRKGVTIVAAIGNDGSENFYYPSAHDYVIAVGATGTDGATSAFSTRGRPLDLVAPGEDIYSSYAGGRYAFSSGTSQAAPFVAGAAALLHSMMRRRGRTLADRQVKHVLKATADRTGPHFRTKAAGWGQLNVADALRYLDHRATTRAMAA